MTGLLEWIDIKKINWLALSFNPNAITLLEENQHKKRVRFADILI